MRNIFLLGSALLLAHPTPAAAIEAAPAAPAPSSDARTLAELAAPRETMVALNMVWAKRAVLDLPNQTEDSKALESEYPGIHAAMWAGSEAELRRMIEADLPNLWGRLERLYQSELNAKELRAVLAFYRTPTGQALIRQLYSNVDLQPVLASVVESEDGKVSEQAMQAANEAAKKKAIAAVDLKEADFLPLMAAMSLDRLRGVGQKVQQVTMEWVNEEDPASEAAVEKLMVEAATKHIEAAKKSQ